MSPSTHFSRILGAGLLASVLASTAPAQTATTDPVGFVTVDFAANSDSYSFIPFKRTPEFAGAIAANGVSGNTLTVAGTPGFTNSQFVHVQTTQPQTYYALFTSGAKLGMYYTVTANTTGAITIDPAGDDVSGVSGSSFQIIPYDTLGSLFPGGQGITASTGVGGTDRQTEILIPSNGQGTDLSAGAIYFYYSGTAFSGAGWRSTTAALTAKQDEQVLYPDSNFVVRQSSVAAKATYMGTVHMGTLSTPLSVVAGGVPQDNAVALPIAANLTLAQSKLFESGAFQGSVGVGGTDRKDELLVRDNSVAGKDKAANLIYFYYTGTAFGGAGWRLTTDSLLTKHDSDVVISPTLGLTVRKRSDTALTALWTVKPPYVP